MKNSVLEYNSHSIKTIYVYLNGSAYAAPKKVLLDSRKQRNWSRILEEVTKIIKTEIVVKKIFTANGIPVYDFSQLENFENYVVSDSRNFIPVHNGYVDQRCRVKYLNPYSNCALWLKNLKNNLTHVRPDLLTIYVYKNNEANKKPIKFVFTQSDLTKWTKSLNYIARSLDLPSETIKNLYTTTGEKICGAWELQHGGTYIAVGIHEKFVPGTYKNSICTSRKRWKYGVPYVYKPKLEYCEHKKPNININSWECNINWKHFNQRYVDFFDGCVYNKESPCRPQCDCSESNYILHSKESDENSNIFERNFDNDSITDISDDNVSNTNTLTVI